MSPPPPRAAWRRNQQVMVATVFVVYSGFASVIPFLPLFVRELGIRETDRVALWAGVLISIAPFLAGLFAPLWGRLGDRHGRKLMVVTALAVYIVVLALTAGVRSVEQLLATRMVIGLFGGIGPLSLAMASAGAPREQTGRVVGSVQSAQILSAAIGPLLGGLLADLIGIRATFLVTAAICAVGLLLVLCAYSEPSRESLPGKAHPTLSLWQLLRQTGVLPLLTVLFFANFIGRSFAPILPLYLDRLGVATSRLALHTGLVISCYSVAAAISATALGRASRRRSPHDLLLVTLVAGGGIVLPMALVTSFPPMLMLATLLGLAFGGSLTLCYTMGGLLVPEGQRASAFGLFAAAALFGGALSPTVAGLLVRWDLRGIFFLDAALFAALVITLLASRRAHRSVPQSEVRSPHEE